MPSTTSSSFSRPEPSSTVMTPSLPTLSIASAMILPMASSELAEMVPTWAIALLSVQGLGIFLSSAAAADAAFRAERDLDGVRQDVHTLHHAGAGVVAELNFFCCHIDSSKKFGISINLRARP